MSRRLSLRSIRSGVLSSSSLRRMPLLKQTSGRPVPVDSSPHSYRGTVELHRNAKAKQESGADTAASEEFWKDQSLLFGVLVWLCHGSGDLEQVASNRVSRSEKTLLRPSCAKWGNQFEKTPRNVTGCR